MDIPIREASQPYARLYPVPSASVGPLLAAGLILGAAGDALLRAPGEPALNLSLWIASVAAAAVVLHRRAALVLQPSRVGWLAVGVLFSAGLAWRDSEPLKLLALGAAVLTFAIAAHRPATHWVRRAGLLQYGGAVALGALHAWTAASLAVFDATRVMPRIEAGTAGWRRAAGIARGLAIAAPLVAIFGALFMSADAVFAGLVEQAVRFDFEWIATHVVLFAIFAWISTGYLRGFLTGTQLPPALSAARHGAVQHRWPRLGITEVATAMAAIDALFLLFVLVQFRYLFGSDALVQITPGLTYADYARRGFFELVFAVALVVPLLLAADWVFERRERRDALVFGALAAAQILLVLAIAASALQRLRLYHASYGLTESRFYAMALLGWIAVMLIWLGATVLRGRRERFAFGMLTSALATVAMLFVINPDALIARANIGRMWSAEPKVRFDVAYASSLSADAVPELIQALPALPADVQCHLASRMLARWSGAPRSLRTWNWSASRAGDVVRSDHTYLSALAAPGRPCGTTRMPMP